MCVFSNYPISIKLIEDSSKVNLFSTTLTQKVQGTQEFLISNLLKKLSTSDFRTTTDSSQSHN